MEIEITDKESFEVNVAAFLAGKSRAGESIEWTREMRRLLHEAYWMAEKAVKGIRIYAETDTGEHPIVYEYDGNRSLVPRFYGINMPLHFMKDFMQKYDLENKVVEILLVYQCFFVKFELPLVDIKQGETK
jgi:hypothetical protein